MWNSEQINESLKIQGLEWKWGPPNCPHFGGVWERMVQSAKRHLKFILEDELSLDVFETALSQVSAVLNSRPLTYASTDVDDMRVLSPANFLYPYTITPSSSTILPPLPADGDHLRGAWREVRRITTLFQERWYREYIQTLSSRNKWRKTEPKIYEGQIVLLVDDQEARANWRLARVEKLLSEDAQHPRRAIVKTADGKKYERHVKKLVVLELDQDTDEKKEQSEKI